MAGNSFFWKAVYLKEKFVKGAVLPVLGCLPRGLLSILLDGYLLFQRAGLKTGGSYKLIFFVTNRCNLNCSHCFYKSNINRDMEELTLGQISVISSSMKNRIYCLVLTGGEPFLREDLDEICLLFNKNSNCKTVFFVTNGFHTPVIMDKLRKIIQKTDMVFNLQFSLDGGAELHNRIRENSAAFGNLMNTIEAVKRLKQEYPRRIYKLTAVTTFSKANIQEAASIIRLVQDLGGLIHYYTVCRSSRLHAFNIREELLSDNDPQTQNLLSADEIGKLYQIFDRGLWSMDKNVMDYRLEKEKHKLCLDILERKISPECFSGYLDIVLYPDGGIARCEMLRPIGNVKETDCDFSRFMSMQKARDFFRKTSDCSCIHDCALLSGLKLNKGSLLRILSGS